jgi:small multidrug resistance pump
MLDTTRTGFYRLFFALAAAYNVAFAAWAIVWPRAFFDLFAMDAPRYPAIWQCLGMVVGVYGLGYAYAAWRLDRAFPFVALGLLGKTLGPIGWVATVHGGEWPIRTFTLILFNDLVWWLPFGLFLLEGTHVGARLRASAPYLCAALNFAAALAIPLALSSGMETVSDRAARVDYIGAHPVLWRAGWSIWIVAALSLLGFYGWWAARVRSRSLGIAALILAVAGIGGDLLAESLYIGWLPADYDRVAPLARLLTGAWGNTLYTLSGILLTLGSPWLRGPARACAWLIWAAGVALGGFSLAGSTTGMAVSMALLFILFCPWVGWVGFLDRRRVS